MNKNAKVKKVNSLIIMFLTIVVLYSAIKLGTIVGNFTYQNNFKIIQEIDVHYFKNVINSSFPIINNIYNSGIIETTFGSELRKSFKSLLNVDFKNPITILNAQSSYLTLYYNKDYKNMLAEKNQEEISNDVPDINSEGDVSKPKEDSSSINIDEVEGQKKTDENNYSSSGRVSIINETKYKVNIEELLKQPLNLKFDNKLGQKILIYHTHTTEGYLNDLKNLNNKSYPSRTDDQRYNVVRVGDELASVFKKKYGLDSIHNATNHVYPNDIGSYGRSLETAQKIMKSYPSIKVAFDIHRDGISNDEKLRVIKNIDGKNAAQIMFVVGTDQLLTHPNWRENLKFALKLQDRLNELYPGLVKPIDLSFNRYNQHLSNGSLIVEIGGDGNLIDEAVESTKYLARAVNDVLN